MIYTIEDITVQIDEFFKDFSKEERDIAEKVKEDVASVISDNIENACVRIKDYIDLSDANGKKIFKMKNKLPDWIKTLVYVCIYNYLTDGKAEYTQTELLEKIGIPKDIFRKKHWNMYSPDMKCRQQQYEKMYLPFKHSEIEGNEIFRAMIHYMTCFSKEATDTFVDVFGKLGIIPVQCAGGYHSKQVWLMKQENVARIFRAALKKNKKVCKILKELQYKIEHSECNHCVGIIKRILGITAVHMMYAENADTVEWIITDGFYNGDTIYTFAAYYVILLYFQPEYWIDANLIPLEEEGDSETRYSNELKLNLSKQRINKFIETDFSDSLAKLSELYHVKSLEMKDIDIREIITNVDYEDDIYEYIDRKALLYADVPKYIREEKIFHFTKDMYITLFDILNRHEGDWILTWKNYVEISLYHERSYESGNGERAGQKKIGVRKLRTDKKILPMIDIYEYEADYEKEIKNEMLKLYDEMLKISENRQLYVFRYRDNNRNRFHPNSIIFITTIDFKEIKWNEFCEKYEIEEGSGTRIEKLRLEDFVFYAEKWHVEKETVGEVSELLEKIKSKSDDE